MTQQYEMPPLPKLPMNDPAAAHKILNDYGKACARAAIKADRQRRGEPVAWIRKNGFSVLAEIEPQDDSEVPLYAAPQPAEPDYKQLFEQMCERCDALDAKLAEYSEREPVKVPSDDERAAQGLPPYSPSHLTEEEWNRLTENGRKAWGKKPDEPEKEPPCDT